MSNSRKSATVRGSPKSSTRLGKTIKDGGSLGSVKTATISSSRSGSKYGTVSGAATPSPGGGKRSNILRMGFFDDPKDDVSSANRRESAEVRVDKAGRPAVAAPDDVPWEVSVAERKLATKRNKRPADPGYTVYVTTPTSSLTLARSISQVAHLDSALRDQLPSSLLPPVSPLPRLASSTPRANKRNVLATLSRTFSSSKQQRLPLTTPIDTSAAETDDERNPLASLSTYLTDLAKHSQVRAHTEWRRFFDASGSEDLVSKHVERRVRKVRSDLAAHTSSPTTATSATMEAGETNNEMDVDRASSVYRAEELVDAVTAGEELERLAGAKSIPIIEVEAIQVEEDGAGQEVNGAPASPKDLPFASTLEATNAPVTEAEQGLQITVADFEIIKVLGKGCAGKVLLVRNKQNQRAYALKTIYKRHVLAHRELEHTMTEQRVLKRVAEDRADETKHTNPFIIALQWSFHDPQNLYLCIDFHPGGDLATQLSRWGRLKKDRCRFYSAEIASGLEYLHQAGIIYRDLKPENVLIGADGHIVLTDFGLSKDFQRVGLSARKGRMSEGAVRYSDRTRTFCGTAEYLAPEVLLGEKYSYEVDWWSYGTMLWEMLYGQTPFFADNHADMYKRVIYDELHFPRFQEQEDNLDQPARSFLRGLLQKDPDMRICDGRVQNHAYFASINWRFIVAKRYAPPFQPKFASGDDTDTTNFDVQFLTMEANLEWESKASESSGDANETRTSLAKEPQPRFKEDGTEVFEGYDFASPLLEYGDEEEEEGAPEQRTSEPTDDLAAAARGATETGPEQPDEQELEAAEADDEVGELATSQNMARSSSVETAASDDVDADEANLTADSAMHSPASTRPTSVDANSPMPNVHTSSTFDSLAPSPSTSPKLDTTKPMPQLIDAIDLIEEDEGEWDVVEAAAEIGPGTRNGGEKLTTRGGPRSLFARGVVDKYRLQLASIARPLTSDGRAGLSRANSHRSSTHTSVSSSTPPIVGQIDANDLPSATRRPAIMERSTSSIGFAFLASPRRRRPKRTHSSSAQTSPTTSGQVTPTMAAAPSPRLLATEAATLRAETPQSQLTLSVSNLGEVTEAEETDAADDVEGINLAGRVKRRFQKRLTLQGQLGGFFSPNQIKVKAPVSTTETTFATTST